MTLARKLTLALALGIFAVMAVNAWVRLAREIDFFEADLRQDERMIGRVMRAAVQSAWQSGGEAGVRDLVQRADDNVSEVRFRWVDLDAPVGDPTRPVVDPARIRADWDGARIVRVQRQDGGEDTRYAYVPITTGDGRIGVLELTEFLLREHRHLRLSVLQSIVTTLVIAGACALIAMGTGFWFVGRPIRMLCEQARRIGGGDLSVRVPVRQRDEIGQLATEINTMCDRLSEANRRVAAETEARIATLDQLRHADRLKTVGQLASGVAHELGTPLNVIAGRAKMLTTGGLSPEEHAKSTRVIAEQTERITAIIRQLLDFARRRGPQLGDRDVQHVIRRIVEMLTPLAEKHGVELVHCPPHHPLAAAVDESQLQQALTNLAMNGIQAMAAGGRLEIAAVRRRAEPQPGHEEAPAAEYVCITVRDQGIGIAPEHLAHVFEPFFTTKSVGEGTGLGLSVAYGIVREHGGWIDVRSTPGAGTKFAVYLRPARAAAAPGWEGAA